MSERLTIYSVDRLTPDEVMAALAHHFDEDIPAMIDPRLNDWTKYPVLLVRYSNALSFLCGLYGRVNHLIRFVDKKSAKYQDLAAKRDVIEQAKNAVEHKYDGASRSFTIYDEERKRAQ
jgi:hypothetical protein